MSLTIASPVPSNDAPDLLDKRALAAHIGFSVRRLEELVKAGDFPPGERVGRFLFWEKTVIGRWRDKTFAAQRFWAAQ